MSSPPPTNIAIIGGGIAGLTLAIGLQKYPHITFTVYESARSFGEIGAGVVLGPNAQHAMEIIDPRILEGYNRRAAFDPTPADEEGKYPWMTVTKGQEPDLGQLVMQFKHKIRGSTTHRAHFLDELVKLLEPGKAQFGKRLEKIEEQESPDAPLTMVFKDGTTATADVVIGADGVHSAVRKHVLGPQNPTSSAFFTGAVQYRATVPIAVAEAKLGKLEQKPASLNGKNGFIFGFPLANRTLYYIGVSVFGIPHWDHDKWTANANVEEIKANFAEWSEFSRNLVGLMPDDGSVMAWSIWEMPPASTYFKGRVAITGDAAHASTPFQGAGAGQAIEDALVLEQLLGKYLDPSTLSKSIPSTQAAVPYILQAYDTVRRFRSQKVVTSSRQTGRIGSMNEPGVGARAEDVRKAITGRQDWIWDLDQKQQVKDALQLMDEMVDAIERREGH